MFNGNSRDRKVEVAIPLSPLPPSSRPRSSVCSVIGADVTIIGNITATADLQIDGRVDGDLDCGTLVQGADSRINGALKADAAKLGGHIVGAVSVRQLTIERAARITGDVEYETITIENGASIDGRLKHVLTSVPHHLAEATVQFVNLGGVPA